MAFVELNPTYREYLERHGLTEPGRFLALPGVIVTGHPQRHVLRLTLDGGPSALVAFLKKEHRVSWKDRLASAWAGFGLVSKSRREAATLRALAAAGVGCPDWVAVGEDDNGCAFLLLRESAGGEDLRRFLQRQPFPPAQRRWWARFLGEALARLHAAGFNHPDLYAKHVLVHPEDGRVSFLDWQRSRRYARLSWRRRGRDLAALNATLADELASPGERFAVLHAYCRAAGLRGSRRRLGRFILRESERLLRRRRIREMRQPPLRTGAQDLIWLEGEALCVTPDFYGLLGRRIPPWLKPAGRLGDRLPPVESRRMPAGYVVRSVVTLPGGRVARLVCRRVERPWGCLAKLLGRQPPIPPELEQVALLYRLQRHGIATPKLLAFGRHTIAGRTEAFLLTEPLPESVGLFNWLANRAGPRLRPVECRRRRRLIRVAAAVLQVLHASGYVPDPGEGDPGSAFCVRRTEDGDLTVGLSHAGGWRRRRRPVVAARELARCFAALPAGLGGRTDALRFLLAYLGQRRPNAATRRAVRRILPRTPAPRQVTLWTSPCAMKACCPRAAVARRTLPT